MSSVTIILFVISSILLGIGFFNYEEQTTSQANLSSMTTQTAQEFSTFSQAVVNYVQSVGLPLPGTNLTVSNLQAVNQQKF